jgi:DNA-binding NarL/FixJ family response regulator
MRRARLVLADDHQMIVDALRRVVEPEFEVVETVGDGRALLTAVETHRPDLIIVDVSMPLLNGIEATRKIKKTNPRVKVIVLTMHDSPEFASQAMEAGASGYVLKHSASEELVLAIREVLKGNHYVTPLIAKGLMQVFIDGRDRAGEPAKLLSGREREVLQLIAEGKTMKEAGSVMSISAKTVEFHKYNIAKKLDLRTSAELVRYAVKHGLIAP